MRWAKPNDRSGVAGGDQFLRLAIVVGLVALVALAPVGVAHVPSARADASGPQVTWTPTGLPGRSGAATAFDEATGTTVLFGGQDVGATHRDA